MKRLKSGDHDFVKLMLDSGAFSAWNRKEVIDINAYIEFVHSVKDHLESYVSLDVLPFGAEKKRSAESVEACAQASYDNLKIFHNEGLKPIPVFHQGERFYWLEKMISEGERYIGLSTRKDLWVRSQQVWLDKCFTLLTDSNGWPIVKTHGFGITKFELMNRYPWATVDSTTWALHSGFGALLVPQMGYGRKPNYLAPPHGILVTGELQSSASAMRRQHDRFAVHSKSALLDWVEQYLSEHVKGVTFGELRHSPAMRRRANLIYFRNAVEARKRAPFVHRLSTFARKSSDGKPIKDLDFTIMHATAVDPRFFQDLTACEIRTRLVSYYELTGKSKDFVLEFIKTGLIPGKFKRKTNFGSFYSQAYRNFRALSLMKRLGECGGLDD